MRPFTAYTTDEQLSELRARIAATRWPDQLEPGTWAYGTDLDYLRGLCDYWQRDFDWRAVESRLNQFEQLLTTVDGQQLHVVHARSPHPDALPLVITHGWPGSVLEFAKILGPLTDPTAHGGAAQDAFHVICPSMPGYGFSGPTTESGWDFRRVARAEATVLEQLGYARYGIHGGDWGAYVSAELARRHPERAAGLHLTLMAGPPADPSALGELTEAERARIERNLAAYGGELAYAAIQGTKPQTLAYGLNDSPAGLAAWIVEKYRSWTDCGGDIESCISRDELLATITLYWLTGTVGSAARLYYETRATGWSRPDDAYIATPTGFAIFPEEIVVEPRAWVERFYNVTRWTSMPRGGHFPALEQPDALVIELRAFFRDLRR